MTTATATATIPADTDLVLRHTTTGTTHVEARDNFGFTFCGKSALFGPLVTVEDMTPVTCQVCQSKM